MNKSGNDRQIYSNKKIKHVCYKGNLYAPSHQSKTNDLYPEQSLEVFQKASVDSEFNFNDRVTITPVLNTEGEWVDKYYVNITNGTNTETWSVATDVIRAPKVASPIMSTVPHTSEAVTITMTHATNDLLDKITSLDDILSDATEELAV